MYQYKTFKDMVTTIKINLVKLEKDFDLIVGVPRSGMIPAYIIGLYLNKKVCSLDEFLTANIPSNGERKINCSKIIKKVLIVDDSINSGRANVILTKRLEQANIKNIEIKRLVVYGTDNTANKVDYCFEIVDNPRIFEWNYLNHSHSSMWAFDIDGVLCEDPTPEQNDDGERYREFILNAKPLYIPNYKIYALVTSRLEKYRVETEEWLRNNNVIYERLFMLDLPSAEERKKLNAHATYKALIYGNLNKTVLFVESETRQAKEISLLTDKPCISVENNVMYFRGIDISQQKETFVQSGGVQLSLRLKAYRAVIKMKIKRLINKFRK